MSDTNDFDSELNPEFWREYIEERERLAQLRDEAVARQFWAFKFADRLI
jgi:hypothetical protein